MQALFLRPGGRSPWTPRSRGGPAAQYTCLSRTVLTDTLQCKQGVIPQLARSRKHRGRGYQSPASVPFRALHSSFFSPVSYLSRQRQALQRFYLPPRPRLPVRPRRLPDRRIKQRSIFTAVNSDALLRAAVCARRQVRKEVLHAKGVGGSRVRAPRFRSSSKIKC